MNKYELRKKHKNENISDLPDQGNTKPSMIVSKKQ